MIMAEENQATISQPVSVAGIGLHTGDDCSLRFLPAEAEAGYRFRRVDVDGAPEIGALAENVTDTSRGTTLAVDGVEVHTVEHILSALRGCGIDNVVIELDNHEPPVIDGSSWPFVRALRQAGRVEQSARRRYLAPKEILECRVGEAEMILLPHQGSLQLSFSLHFDHPVLRSQYREFVLEPERYAEEIAPARTFCFLHEVSLLRQAGLIKGGSLNCAVVIGEEEVLNDNLRFADEFVRHKLLDLVGDLTLVGSPLRARVISIKGGHTANVALALELRKRLGLLDGNGGS
jgi:UDP-3-O-acyl N-acetylglucosamine deacetylase